MPSKAELETIVQKAFELYDADKSGFLERDEIMKLLNDACAAMSCRCGEVIARSSAAGTPPDQEGA